VQIRSGSLLIAHPVHADREKSKHVVYITESTGASTMGLVLNNLSTIDLKDAFERKGIEWYGDRELYTGGEYNPNALVMLHSDEWYSANTMQVDTSLAVSSDNLMVEKMAMGNTPDWYKLFVGCKGWEPLELQQELKGKRPKWLLHAYPSLDLITNADNRMWDLAIKECSQDLFNDYF
jgi:putative transcriptional regulator